MIVVNDLKATQRLVNEQRKAEQRAALSRLLANELRIVELRRRLKEYHHG